MSIFFRSFRDFFLCFSGVLKLTKKMKFDTNNLTGFSPKLTKKSEKNEI